MILGPLEVVCVNGMFILTFTGAHGPRGLGAAKDLKAFVEGRMAGGMLSTELAACLQQLIEIGDANDWNFEAMSAQSRP